MVKKTLVFIACVMFLPGVQSVADQAEHSRQVHIQTLTKDDGMPQKDNVMPPRSSREADLRLAECERIFAVGKKANGNGKFDEALEAFDILSATGASGDRFEGCPTAKYMASAANIRLKMVEQLHDLVTLQVKLDLLQRASELYVKALRVKALAEALTAEQKASVRSRQSNLCRLELSIMKGRQTSGTQKPSRELKAKEAECQELESASELQNLANARADVAKELQLKQQSQNQQYQVQLQEMAEANAQAEKELTQPYEVKLQTMAEAEAEAETELETKHQKTVRAHEGLKPNVLAEKTSLKMCPYSILNAPKDRVEFKKVDVRKHIMGSSSSVEVRNSAVHVQVTCNLNKGVVEIKKADVSCRGRKSLCADAVRKAVDACPDNPNSNKFNMVSLEFSAKQPTAGCQCYIDMAIGLNMEQLTVSSKQSSISIPLDIPKESSRSWCNKVGSDSEKHFKKSVKVWTFSKGDSKGNSSLLQDITVGGGGSLLRGGSRKVANREPVAAPEFTGAK